ncbi:TonB-dependent receptor [bacterium]|nr:TonB-dependent receptor [bacterium]MCI0604613.1 TonB-dependent receptor [bacterium]
MLRIKGSNGGTSFIWMFCMIFFAAAILCLPLSFAAAQSGDTQSGETEQEEEQAEGQEEAQEEAEEEEEEAIGLTEEQEITVTGTRVQGRTVTDTPAPVDFINNEMLKSTGATETGKILQMLAPSFNFSTTYISDGTDIIRPATLRSLGADQVLVLVNGKRRHQQSLLNVQQTIARGQAGTDINAIPVSAIDHIEVLRDGAAAQYGSDAIAGVINIILKDGYEGEVLFQAGQTYEGDGGNGTISINKGFKVGEKGVINVTGEYRDRNETNRAGADSLRVSPPRVVQRIGDPDAKDGLIWANVAIPAGDGNFYAFGGWSQRQGNSSGFFRSAGDGRTIPAIYPNGFLPTIITEPTDTSIVAGYRHALSTSWNYDVSFNFGQSEFQFREENTANVSWFFEPLDRNNPTGPRFEDTPTEADTGNLRSRMTSLTFDVTGTYDWGVGSSPLFIAVGAEWRRDGYKITAGDLASFSYGRTNDRTIEIFDQTGAIAQPGAQGFPGWSPTEEVDDSRSNTAIYVDTEAQFTEKFLMGAAARFEHYSDFGNTVTGKLSARYEFVPEFSLRGTVSNGFRAPGIQQALYSQRSTNLNAAGVLTDTLTAKQDSAVTRQFGIPALKEETSTNLSIGIIAKQHGNFRVTVDYFYIDIDDRIIFSSNIQPEDPAACGTPAGCPIRNILDPLAVGQILFFTNAIDTTTKGVDIVAIYDIHFANKSMLSLEGAFNFNKTEVTNRRSSSAILPVPVLFDQAQITLIEEGQPRQHHTLSGTYYRGPWTGNVRFNYFGEVAGEGFTPGFKQVWSGKWLTDAFVSYSMKNGVTVAFGGTNIFDVYPDEWDPDRAFPFPQLGFVYGWETLPFGINGASYYVRASYQF